MILQRHNWSRGYWEANAIGAFIDSKGVSGLVTGEVDSLNSSYDILVDESDVSDAKRVLEEQKRRYEEDVECKKQLAATKRREQITQDLVALIRSWRHSGFQVYVGPRIQPGEEEATENLARYIIRASFSQQRMTYLPEESKVIYESKDGKEEKVFDALDWLAAMGSHVPNKGEQMVRYYGHYSNASRGLRQKKNLDDLIPSILEPEYLKPNRTWARLIQKIGACPRLDRGRLIP